MNAPSLLNHIFTLAQAPAGGAPQGGGGLFGNPLVFMVLMMVMMYFLLIRPQRKRQKDHEALIKSVAVGDHVVLNGGEHGIITSLHEKTVRIKVADNVKIEYDRGAIASVTKKVDVPASSTEA